MRGHKFFFIIHNVDIDCIHVVAIESRKKGKTIGAFKEACDELTKCGFEPILHGMDHEKSKGELMQAIESRGLKCQIVMTGVH